MVLRFTILLCAPAAVAAAQEPESAEEEGGDPLETEEVAGPSVDEGWIELAPPEGLPSALEGIAPVEAGEGGIPPIGGAAPARLRGRFFFRPWLGATGIVGAAAGPTAGGLVGHQWWSLRETTVAPVGESRLVVTAPFGRLRGYDLDLASTAGLWAGPVGLLAGGELRLDRWAAPTATVDSGLTLGPTARLALRLGPFSPWVAYTPAWQLWGPRLDQDEAFRTWTQAHPDQFVPTPAWRWGDESTWSGGLEISARPFSWRLSASHRAVGMDTVWTAALGLQLELL